MADSWLSNALVNFSTILYVPASIALGVVPLFSIVVPVGSEYPCACALPLYVYCFTGLVGIVTVAFAIVTLPNGKWSIMKEGDNYGKSS